MKRLATLLSLFFATAVLAQVGISTTTPNAMLDVASTTNGLLIPRIALTGTNVAAPVVNPQGGALAVSTMVYNTATVIGANAVSPGYYYWDGTQWVSITGTNVKDWSVRGNAGLTTPAVPGTYGTSTIGTTENFLGTTDANDVTIGTDNIERLRIKQTTGNVGIGTAAPAAKLDIVAPGNTLGLRLLSGNTTQYSYLSLGRNTEYAQIGAATAGTFFTDAQTGDMAIKNFNSGKILIGANYYAAAAMAINTVGNVGIGTSNPSYRLHVTTPTAYATASYFENAYAGNADAYAIYGRGYNNPGYGYGGYFYGGYVGIRATAPASSYTGYAYGIYGDTSGASGGSGYRYGAYLSASGTNYINYGTASYTSGAATYNVGGLFSASGATANNVGVQAYANGIGPNILYYTTGGYTATPSPGKGIETGGESIGIEARANATNLATVDKQPGFFYVSGGGVPAVASVGSVIDNTTFKILGFGIVSTLVRDDQGKDRIMVAPEAPEALFQDYGTGQLVNGYAKVVLDPVLAKNVLVDAAHPLKVFVQLEGECNGVYVFNKKPDGFEVKELQNGSSNAAFSYQVIATRADEERGGHVSEYSKMRFKPMKGTWMTKAEDPKLTATRLPHSDQKD